MNKFQALNKSPIVAAAFLMATSAIGPGFLNPNSGIHKPIAGQFWFYHSHFNPIGYWRTIEYLADIICQWNARPGSGQ